MQPREASWFGPALERLTRRAEVLAERTRAAHAATLGCPRPSFMARCDGVLAVARLHQRVGHLVADLVAFQVVASNLASCLQAAAAGRALAALSRELLGLCDGHAAGTLADLLDGVLALLAAAEEVIGNLGAAIVSLAA